MPLYRGLIVAQCVYVVHFWVELVDLVGAAFGNQESLAHIVQAVGYGANAGKPTETTIMHQPEWLSHVNASVLEVKLATAIIGVSSIHLLKTFINAEAYSEKVLLAQAGIHIAFLLSAMAIAACDRIMVGGGKGQDQH